MTPVQYSSVGLLSHLLSPAAPESHSGVFRQRLSRVTENLGGLKPCDLNLA